MRIPAPRVLAAFPDFRLVRSKTPTRGGGTLRRRWKGPDGRIAEWDSLHGALELYSARGRHLGEYDPVSGIQLKAANPRYSVEP